MAGDGIAGIARAMRRCRYGFANRNMSEVMTASIIPYNHLARRDVICSGPGGGSLVFVPYAQSHIPFDVTFLYLVHVSKLSSLSNLKKM